MKKIQQIDYACRVNEKVFYTNVLNEKFYGTLIEWKDNIAVLKMVDGTIKEVEC